MEKIGIYTKIDIKDKEYPEKLRIINDPPKELYCIGDIKLLHTKSVAIVGSRKTCIYGKWVSEAISSKLCEYGITVVSGMARGIDTFAHSKALECNGKTIAVLGCGIDKCFPVQNWKLKDQIIQNGLVISEYPPGTNPAKWTFPQRNRIISALSDIVVVAEAGLNSGALITAERGAEQGKLVLVVPSNINNLHNIGGNKLIGEGASPLIVVDDVIEYLGVRKKEFLEENLNLGKDEEIVFKKVLETGEISVDDLCKALGKDIKVVNAMVTILEMKGLVQTSFGKVFVAKFVKY